MTWFVYILQNQQGTLYTGITTDPDRRLHEHNHTNRAARFTRSRRPWTRIYLEAVQGGRPAALRRERQIKRMSRQQRLGLAISLLAQLHREVE